MFKKGQTPWNKGKKGVMPTPWNKNKRVPAISGKNHYLWDGEKGSYATKHIWISYHYGKANKCENRGKQFLKFPCTNMVNIFEWANKSHQYKREISDFMQLCKSCHFKYDMTDVWRAKMYKYPKGHTPWNKGLEGFRSGKNNNMWKGGRVKMNCKTCDNEMLVFPCFKKGGRKKYCSKKCMYKSFSYRQSSAEQNANQKHNKDRVR